MEGPQPAPSGHPSSAPAGEWSRPLASLAIGLALGLASLGLGAGCGDSDPDCLEGGGVLLSLNGATSERGASASISVALTQAPTHDVVVTFNTSALAPGVRAQVSTLTFSSANWDSPQTIALVATDNGVRDPKPLDPSLFSLETVESEDERFACAAGFVVVPHTARYCKDGELDAAEGEQCEPPRNDLGVPVVDLDCALGEASCERCNDTCQLVPGNFRAVCGDAQVSDVEQCELGDEEPCSEHGFDRGTATCALPTCQWDLSECRRVEATTCAAVEDFCDDCLASEQRHACTLDADGHARCRGLNLDGAATSPTDRTFTQVVDTAFFSCGLEASGAATCWGLPLLTRNSPGPFVELVAGAAHVCGRGQDGTTLCWGENGKGQATVPNGRKFKRIAPGRWHTCGLTLDDDVVCWGRVSGELQHVPENETFTDLASGHHRACGLRADGTVTCWGGGLGCVDPAGTFTSLVGGGGPICGRRADGSIECWRHTGDGVEAIVPNTAARALAAGGGRHCIVTEQGEIQCFGHHSPPLHSFAGPFTQVASGGQQVCGLKANGTLQCLEGLGGPGVGRLRSPLQGAFAEVAIDDSNPAGGCARRADGRVQCWGTTTAPVGSYKTISMRGSLACGVRMDDSVGCWGTGADGLGMPEFDSFSRVSVGGTFVCGVRIDGSVLCWGDEREGVFGQGYALDDPPGRFLDVAAGDRAACAIVDDDTSDSDGTVVCWGHPTSGIRSPPTGRFTTVAVSRTHACGLRVDGHIACWGDENLTTARIDRPSPYTRRGTFDEVRTYDAFGCGRRGDDWKCWGSDAFGRATPDGPTWSQVLVGDDLVCAVTPESQAVCWHANGQVRFDDRYPVSKHFAAGGETFCRINDDESLDCGTGPSGANVGPLAHFSAGASAVCGIRSTPGVAETDGESWCVALREPNGTTGFVGTGRRPFIAVGVGDALQCFVNHEGRPQCQGVLAGLGEPPAELRLKTIDAATGRVCGVTTDDTLGCWGRAETGRHDGAAILDVQLSLEHGCVLTPSNAIECWGDDDFGNTSMPDGTWSQFGVGARQTCGIATDGRLVCRGWLRRDG